MTARSTVNINPASAARLDAIKAHLKERDLIGRTPSHSAIVGRGLELLCAELGVRDPVVPTDRANEEERGDA